MPYTRKFLDKIRRHTPKGQKIMQEMVNKLANHEELTLAEEEFACSIANILRDETGKYMFDITQMDDCRNYRFRGTYLLYANDLDGHGIIRDYRGVIKPQRKAQDVAFLDSEYDGWAPVATGKKTADVFLNYLIDETLHQIKMMEKYCLINDVGADRKAYLHKSIVLQSKFIFLLVNEFHQDFGANEIVLEFHSHKILIDQFCYIHTMFRHFAASVKDYQTDKSYHFDQSVLYQELSIFLKRFVEMFQRNCSKSEFNGRSIDLIFKGKKYSLWFRPFTKPGTTITYLRLQTFYPIEAFRDRVRVQGLKKVKINSQITLLVKYPF